MADALDDLSERLTMALAWARSIEQNDVVGTRSLLIGMHRVDPEQGPLTQLVDVLGLDLDALFQALQDVNPDHRIDPYAPGIATDDGRLTLTQNVDLALELARARSVSSPVEPEHVFGVLLEMVHSTAYAGLAMVLDDRLSMDLVATACGDWLDDPEGPSFADRLRARLAQSSNGTTVLYSPRGPMRALAFSPLGDVLVGADRRGSVARWQAGSSTGEVFGSGVDDTVAFAWSPDGEHLLRMHEDGTGTGRRLRLTGGPRGITGAAWSPDGARICAVAQTGGLYDWWISTVDAPRRRDVVDRPLLAVEFRSADEVVAVDAGGMVWVVSNDGAIAQPSLPTGSYTRAAFSRGGRRVVLADADGAVSVADLGAGKSVEIAHGHEGAITALALSADGARLATAGEDATIRFHDVASRRAPDEHVEWLADAAAREDLLGREQLAAAIAKRLDRMVEATPDESFLLHLDGPWGAGKSSLLHFLRRRLEARWLIVEFDAWRQARVGPPWWALLTSLRKALRRQLGWRRAAWLRVRETAVRLRRDHGVVAFLALVVTAAVAYLLAAPASTTVSAWIALIAATLAAATLLLGPGRGLAAFLMWDSATGARRYEQWHKDPMEGLAEHFGWLVARSPRPILFFIDDLDRCDEQHVVDLLDAIQTLVRDAGSEHPGVSAPCFVVAADGRWIRRSYERRHEGFDEAVAEPGRPLGYLFLDKLFQLTVEVPSIASVQQAAYLRRLLLGASGDAEPSPRQAEERIARSGTQREILAAVRDASPAERLGATAAAIDRLSEPRVERATEHDLQKFSAVLERNPRAMKRFVNAYSMALSTSLLEGRVADPDQLALWTILRLRWPRLADRLREHPEQFDAFLDGGAEVAGNDVLASLAGSDELRRVVHFDEHRRLSGDAVRALTGP